MEKIELKPVREDEIELLHKMQVESFMPLYEKYHDAGNPAIETMDRVKKRAQRPNRQYYFIIHDGNMVGAINLGHNDPDEKHISFISPIFILPQYQNQGIGYKAIQAAFEHYPEVNEWIFETILQEPRNCHLYEKCGFERWGEEQIVNDKMTLVTYRCIRNVANT